MPATPRSCIVCEATLPPEAQFCLHCGVSTPSDPTAAVQSAATGALEIGRVRRALEARYRVERILGEGGMATVYLAEDRKHRRRVALKVMHPELAATVGADRFLREIEITARLTHAHILPVYDSGDADGLLYYVMPYVEEGTLQERLQRETQLPVDDALRVGHEVAEALAYAQARGITHRDVKPGNILLGAGHAQLADFGIAHALDASGGALTRTGIAVGTPKYMAPEQALGDRDVDGRADVYALGAVLYEMLAGEAPFSGPTARAIMTRSMTERPRQLTSSRVGLSAGVDSVVMQALAANPADRHPTALAFAAALARAQDEARGGARPHGGSPTPRLVWGTFGVISATMLVVVAVFARRLALPGWTSGLAGILVLIGAGMMALTARVEARRRAGAAVPGALRLVSWRSATLGGVAALALWAAVATVLAVSTADPRGAAAARTRTRLAILPFANQGDAADAYFADGIADEVRGKLAQVPGLTVIASTSASQYRETTKSPQQVATELDVDYLLLGRVRWVAASDGGRRVQVVPDLVDGRSGTTTWQQSYDSQLRDVFAMQAEIATRVAGALGARLGSREQEQLARRPTGNLAAYDAYLKGRALSSVDVTTQRQAATYFEQAVALDADFTAAWSALVRALARVYFNGSRERAVAERAAEALERALALEPNGAAPHAAAVQFYRQIRPDPVRARREVAAALVAGPNDPDVLASASMQDMDDGRPASGLAKLERARELDPRSAPVLLALGQGYLGERRFADAYATFAAAIAVAPTDNNLVEWAAMAHGSAGDLRGAREVIQAAIDRGASAAELAAFFGGYYEVAWLLDDAEQALLTRLTPAAFDGDRAWWAQSLATALWDRGERTLARAYADSALGPSAAQMRDAPTDQQLRAFYGLMLAYSGRAAEARAQADSAVALSADALGDPRWYVRLQAVRIRLALGDTAQAMSGIEQLVATHNYISPGWLRLDPMFRPLRGAPRFERLAAEP